MSWEPLAFLAILTHGLAVADFGELILRLGVGVPFLISGCNKLFCPTCHRWLRNNLTNSGIACPAVAVWWVAGWEAFAGLLLVLGLFTGAAAFILFLVCAVAFLVSWRRKLDKKNPAHFWDAYTEIGFMFDVLLGWMLLVTMFQGPGKFSLDYLIGLDYLFF